MSEIIMFLKNGWKFLWKNPLLLFMGLIYSGIILTFIQRSQNSVLSLCFIVGDLIIIFLLGFGMLFVSYCTANEIKYNWNIILTRFKKTFARLAGMSCMGLIIIYIFAFIFIGAAFLSKLNLSNSSFALFSIPLQLIGAVMEPLVYFTYLGVIGSDYRVAESIKKEFSIFIRHFWLLFGIGMIFSIARWFVTLIGASSFLLVQAKFNFSGLSGLNFFTPLLNLENTPIYYVNIIISIVGTPYLLLVYTLAYMKFNGIKVASVVETTPASAI